MWIETLDITRYDALTREAEEASPGHIDVSARGEIANEDEHARAQAAGASRVLILGWGSEYILGDRAALVAVCESLQHADPGVRITITSARQDLASAPGVVNVIRPGLAGYPALLAAARTQAVIIVGDRRLQDEDGRLQALRRVARLRLLRRCNSNIRTARALPMRLDPVYALNPAPGADADRFLRDIGLNPCRPIIGVVIHGCLQPPDDGARLRLNALWGLGRNESDNRIARLLDEIGHAIEALARSMDASVLLLPTCNAGPGADSQYCHELAALLELPAVRVARLEDPQLYKAVCGRLRLMISTRTEPLILAAGMGVPGIGLGHAGHFGGFFDMLGIPRRTINLEELSDDMQSQRLVELAEAALADHTDLQSRSELLRRRVMHDVGALLDRPPPEAGT
jgi:polysaccharide pyruvyl transferase WcaK-like protein